MARNLLAEMQTGTSPVTGRNLLSAQAQQSQMPDPYQELAAQQGPFKTAAISAGRGLFKIGRALGLAEPESEEERLAFEALEQQRPISTMVGEAVGTAAPFALIPQVGIGGAAGRIGQAAGVGALESALISRGEGQRLEQQLQAGGVGGVAAGALEASIPVIGRVAGPIFRRIMKRDPAGGLITRTGEPTAELNDALNRAGLEYQDIVDAAEQLVDAPAGTDPLEAARSAFFQQQGITPTRAQVTRDPSTFQMQQELAKGSGRVRQALEQQEEVIAGRFENAIEGIGGQGVQDTAPVVDAIKDRSTRLTSEINNLYKEAREIAGDQAVIDVAPVLDELTRMRGSNRIMKGVPSAIKGQAVDMGLIDPQTGATAFATPAEAEQLRQFANSLYNPASPQGNMGIKRIKDAVDSAVGDAVGDDVFGAARQAKAQFEKDLSRIKVDRFDKRKVSIVRDTLDNLIDPDEYFDKTVIGKKYRAEELNQLKKYLTGTGSSDDIARGTQAWDNLRAETMQWIADNAMQGPVTDREFKAMTRASIDRTLKRIGAPKLKVLFNAEERKFLSDMRRLAELREPVRGTAIGKGPSAQAVQGLVSRAGALGAVFSDIAQRLKVGRDNRLLVRSTPSVTPPSTQLAPGAGLAGAGVGFGLTQDERNR